MEIIKENFRLLFWLLNVVLADLVSWWNHENYAFPCYLFAIRI